MHTVERTTGRILWANLHLLFWLSLIPFGTGWTGRSHFASLPTAIYGVILLLSALAYTFLVRSIIAAQGPTSRLKAAIGSDAKGYLSLALYAIAIPTAFVNRWLAYAIYVAIALIWFVPDRRIERTYPHLSGESVAARPCQSPIRCSTTGRVTLRAPIEMNSAPWSTESDNEVRLSMSVAIMSIAPRSKARMGMSPPR